MANFFSSLAAVFIIAPALFYILIFLVVKKTSGNQRKARGYAINLTTFILIFSVHYLILAIWSKSLIGLILLIMLSVGILFVLTYWKKRGEIIYPNVLVGYWRLTFLLFSVCYICLFIYGLCKSILEAVKIT
ncbi:DUF3397 domain-containing protein [Bacillus niameyensis]|uniref:DUF3397 domain-containing protein n=1 Tax=Bacillus niameyensis TaxID=1522308 RepID=UPI000782B150|nr:DUF3397 domain-containing protein [Bacillus niameyensis]